MFTINAKLLTDACCELAEGPVWDERRDVLYWLDIKRCLVLCYSAENGCEIVCDFAQNIGCMAQRTRGGMILGLTTGVYLTGEGGAFEKLDAPTVSMRVRFNDGKCDEKGRFWAGTMNLFSGEKGGAALYCVLPDLRVKQMLSGATISNGIAFSHDMRTMYYIDTPTGTVDAFVLEEDDQGFPTLSGRRTVVRVNPADGFPDGMAIDSEGKLWVAHWGGGAVISYDPQTGEKLGSIVLPVKAVTSCCFGGEDMKALFITTAREGMLPGEEQIAGCVFCAQLKVRGSPSYRFAG